MPRRGGWRAVRDQFALYRAASASGPDNPGSVRSDDESQALFDSAVALAGTEVEDQVARDELRKLAGSRRKTLERAEKASRLGRRHLEASEHANRVHRLLYAALHDVPVTPADPDVLAQIAEVRKAFATGAAREEVWGRLLAAEPRLPALLADSRHGRFGEDLDSIKFSAGQLAAPEVRRCQYESSNGSLELAIELKGVIGPLAESSDVIVGSERAYGFAYMRLLRERPIPTDLP